ncbi:MAG: DEAD/DEAH box helicase family protein [Actinobacteria bacterium]|nr:DEAD/DEAH box helicase family protein [Actinomycetota bacterium]
MDDPRSVWQHVELRDHQLEALDELHGRIASGVKRTWVDAPTGSGKTITFCALAAALGGSAVVLVPRRNLADQTALGLARYFPTVPRHLDGLHAVGKPGVVIVTYQAALRHADAIPWDTINLLICDEAHTTLGAQTRRLLDRATNALIVGFTATPATTTGHVEQVFGPVAATLDRLSAINRGILCPLRSLRVERAVDLSDVARVRGDFDQASLGRALDRALWHRACAEVWVEHFAPLGLAGVAYTATVAQAHSLAEELAARDVRAAAVSGQTTAKELQRILREFASGRIDVLCNADLLTEGWDETRAAVVMHLAPTTSERVFVQRLGRVMRPAEGKEAVSVEFLPVGDPMGVQTSHELFGMGWYKPLGRVAGPPDGMERGRLAQAAKLLGEQEGDRARLVNPDADFRDIAAGLVDGGWRDVDPGELPASVMEEWIEAAARDTEWEDVSRLIEDGISDVGAPAWWGLTGVVSRRAAPGVDQPLWRAWATALLVQPDLRSALPADAPRAVLDRLRMGGRERLRSLWSHASASNHWERLPQLE